MKTKTKNNKKSYRIILVKTYSFDTPKIFSNAKQVYDWLENEISSVDFERQAEQNGIDEDFAVFEIDKNGNTKETK
jgi:hypothetical protein